MSEDLTPDLAQMREVAEKALTAFKEDGRIAFDFVREFDPGRALSLLDRIAELTRERDSWKAHAEHHFGHMRAALDLSYALRYPADPTLLDLIANEITCDDRCENAWREHDTNASGCTKSDSEEGCAWEKAQALRDLAKAIRDQAWLLAFSPPSPAQAAEAQVSALTTTKEHSDDA